MKYLFILIIALIIILICIIIYYLKKENLYNEKSNEKEINLYTGAGAYRLGDGFYLTDYKDVWIKSDKNNVTKNYESLSKLIKLFPNSILAEYLKLSNFKAEKYDILLKIVKNRFKKDNLVNKKTDCLLHLRVGDVIDELCNKENFVNKFYHNITKVDFDNNIRCNYIKPLSYFIDKIKILHRLNIKKIYIICGAHIKLKNYNYSIYYIKKIKNIFNDAKIDVILKIANHPDIDLLFSMNFDYFIPSNGQYSRLILDVNKKINYNFKIL